MELILLYPSMEMRCSWWEKGKKERSWKKRSKLMPTVEEMKMEILFFFSFLGALFFCFVLAVKRHQCRNEVEILSKNRKKERRDIKCRWKCLFGRALNQGNFGSSISCWKGELLAHFSWPWEVNEWLAWNWNLVLCIK